MSKEEMDKIFDPFYTTKFTGRGLGLAVAMSLIRAWGGMIHVQSEVNKGSCFDHINIDCLLLDLSMPDMDGWKTLAALRKIKPDLPAILCSGYDEARVMNGDHKELPQAFLHKPYTKDNLKNVLNQILGDATNGEQ